MNEGAYSLIRSIPDPIRAEVFNIGLIAWSDDFAFIKVDADAARRAMNQSRYLAKDAWTFYEAFFRESLVRDERIVVTELEDLAAHPRWDTLRLSPPSYMTFEEGEHGFNERVREILKRLVLPVHRGGGSGSPTKDIKRRLKPFIDQQIIHENHPFKETRSTVQRSCDFFANSGADVALDTLRLDLSKADVIYERIDAEAAKISDVKEANANVRFIVYCQPGHGDDYFEIEDRARKVFRSVRAEVVTDPDEASTLLKRAADRSRPQQSELVPRS